MSGDSVLGSVLFSILSHEIKVTRPLAFMRVGGRTKNNGCKTHPNDQSISKMYPTNESTFTILLKAVLFVAYIYHDHLEA